MRTRTAVFVTFGVLLSCASGLAQSSSDACDLSRDGRVNIVDCQLAVNMTLGLTPCTANIIGAGLCDSEVVSRIVTAALGGLCNSHYVALSWTASTSANIRGYNIYRGSSSGGTYLKLTTSLVSGTNFTDASAVAGQTYYYVATAVDNTGAESGYSGESRVTVPIP